MGRNVSEEAESSDAAARTFTFDRMALSNAQRIWLCRGSQQSSAEFQTFRTTAVSEEAKVSDLDEAWWQDVKEETPNELDRFNRHELLRVVVGRVSPAESNLSVSQFEQTTVGDGNAMRIACQILQDVFGSAKRSSDFHHPLRLSKTAYEAIKGFQSLEWLKPSLQSQFLTAKGGREERQELATKQASEYGTRKEESFAAVDPA